MTRTINQGGFRDILLGDGILCSIQGLKRSLPSSEDGRVVILRDHGEVPNDELSAKSSGPLHPVFTDKVVDHEERPDGRMCYLATQRVVCNGVREHDEQGDEAAEERDHKKW